jgi:hypothetical protein
MRAPWRLRELQAKAWNEFEFRRDQAKRLNFAAEAGQATPEVGTNQLPINRRAIAKLLVTVVGKVTFCLRLRKSGSSKFVVA